MKKPKKQKPVPPLADIIVAVSEIRNRDDAQKCQEWVMRCRELSAIEQCFYGVEISTRLHRIEIDRRLVLIERALAIRSQTRSRIPPRSRKAPRIVKH
jgi:hypothetical protein